MAIFKPVNAARENVFENIGTARITGTTEVDENDKYLKTKLIQVPCI